MSKKCTPECTGSGDCPDCCPDCDALRSDGVDDGPCDRHKKPAPFIGRIIPAKTLIMRHNVGTATGDEGDEYEMTTTVNDRSPMVKSMKTGKTFHLNWNDIINLAVQAGVNIPDEPA